MNGSLHIFHLDGILIFEVKTLHQLKRIVKYVSNHVLMSKVFIYVTGS